MADPKLVVALEARLNKFESDLKQAGLIADREVRSIEDRFARANPKFGPGFLGGLFGGAVGALSIGAIANLVQNTYEGLAKIGDVADRVGVTAEQLQEIRYALEQSGGQAEQAGPALERFANNIAKASEGENKLGRFLEENNVRLKDRNGVLRPTAELLSEVANLIQNAASPQERLNIAIEFFGRSAGPAMATALANGSAGLRNFGAEARSAGAVIENELIKKAQEIDDKFQKLARTLSTTVKTAIVKVVEAARDFIDKSSVASAIDAGTASAEQLATAIQIARSKGSPVDPAWLTELERLLELQRESNRARGMGKAPAVEGSTIPAANNTGAKTNTSALYTRPGGEDGKDAFERATYQAEKRISVLRAENAVIGEGTAARERARLVAELETAAKEANKEAGLKNTEVTAAQRLEIDRLADSMLKTAQVAEAARGPLASFIREGRDLDRNFQEAAVTGLRGFEDALISITNRTQTVSDAFRQMASSIISDIGRILIRAGVSNLLSGIFGGAGGITGSYSMGDVTVPVIGRNARGTNNWRGGLTWVGEEGPELVNLPRGAQVIPNDVARGMGGSITVGGTSIVVQGNADERTLALMREELSRRDAELPWRIRSEVQSRPNKRW